MKPENLTIGHHKIGPFNVSIQRPVFQSAPEETLNYFAVFITRQGDLTFYVDPKELEGFMFLQFGAFDRKLTDEDMVEYNYFVNVKGLVQPNHLMSRNSIVKLLDILQARAKKFKKK